MPLAYGFDHYGGPEVGVFIDRPRPVPGPGQVLIAVRAAGVNPVDWKRRQGNWRPGAPNVELPSIFGTEVSGTVLALGPDVSDFAIGDAVFGNTLTGAYAEETLMAVKATSHMPEGLSFVVAATLPVAGATAYDGLKQLALPAGSTLLLTGTGGGVGVAIAQLARHYGLRVIGTASVAKKAFVESLGVVHVEYGDGVAERVAAAAPEGIDAIYDLIGGPDLEAVASLLADRSKLITAADRDTAAPLGGVAVERARNSEVLDAVAQLTVDGVFRPFITQTFPLQEAGAALAVVEAGHSQGKVVITVD